jgi:hypothetical protein
MLRHQSAHSFQWLGCFQGSRFVASCIKIADERLKDQGARLPQTIGFKSLKPVSQTGDYNIDIVALLPASLMQIKAIPVQTVRVF